MKFSFKFSRQNVPCERNGLSISPHALHVKVENTFCAQCTWEHFYVEHNSTPWDNITHMIMGD
jgi:hypothetical protein